MSQLQIVLAAIPFISADSKLKARHGGTGGGARGHPGGLLKHTANIGQHTSLLARSGRQVPVVLRDSFFIQVLHAYSYAIARKCGVFDERHPPTEID